MNQNEGGGGPRLCPLCARLCATDPCQDGHSLKSAAGPVSTARAAARHQITSPPVPPPPRPVDLDVGSTHFLLSPPVRGRLRLRRGSWDRVGGPFGCVWTHRKKTPTAVQCAHQQLRNRRRSDETPRQREDPTRKGELHVFSSLSQCRLCGMESYSSWED